MFSGLQTTEKRPSKRDIIILPAFLNYTELNMASVILCVFVLLTSFIGAALGSFLNVVIWRVPENMSLVSPPSHCPKCGTHVRWYDNIPIFSWFILRGKCRDCHSPISFRYPLVESLSCLVSLVVCASIFFGGWTGLKSQCLYWDDFATYVEAWGPLFQKGIVSPLDTNVPANVASLVVDDFIRLLFIATSIAIFYTLLADAALMLGFIQYDGKLPPRSLLIGAIVVVLFTAPMVRWLNLSDFGVQMIRTRSFVLSVMLGAIPCLFVKKSDRAVSATLGAIWGVVSGTIWAAPGSILCVLVAKAINHKTGRETLGIIVYAAIAILLISESVFFLVL
jgi:prepilin signal peptidase PulO-like enzyme (type II secretory pathway)